MNTDRKVTRQGLGAGFRRAAAILPSSLIYHPSSANERVLARAFLAPSALFGDAWAARRKASPPLALIHIFLNSKFRIQNLKFLRLSSARPVASPRPSGFRKAPPSATHSVINTRNSKLKTLNSKPWHAPLLGNAGGVGPSALSGFARLRLRRTSSTPRRCGLAFRASGPTAPERPPFGRRDRRGRRGAGERGGSPEAKRAPRKGRG
jgi:hypothetical protein